MLTIGTSQTVARTHCSLTSESLDRELNVCFEYGVLRLHYVYHKRSLYMRYFDVLGDGRTYQQGIR